MRSILAQIISLLTPILVPLIAGYIAYLVQKYVHNDAVLKALQTVGVITKVAVANAAQLTVNDLKDPTKPGTWDKIASDAVRASVASDIRLMGAAPLAVLADKGGWTEKATDALVSKGIESEVHALAAEKPAALVAVVAS